MTPPRSLSDRLSPILVKEVRQGLRSRPFTISYVLTVLTCLVIAVLVLSVQGLTRSAGRESFQVFFFALSCVAFVIVPAAAFRSLTREREDDSWGILQLTGITPRRVLLGKIASSLVQTALFASAVGPFLLFTYYLEGIDLPSIGLLGLLGAVFAAILTTFAVSLGAFPEPRRAGIVVGLLLLILLAIALAFGTAATNEFVRRGQLFKADTWAGISLAMWLMAGATWLVFHAAVARLSLSSEPYARGPRLALCGFIAGTWALGVVAWRDILDDELPHFLLCVTAVAAFTSGWGIATDTDGPGPRGRRLTGAPLFRPGALSGFRFVALVLALTAAGGFLVGPAFHSLRAVTYATVAMPLLGLVYLSLPILIGRGIRWKRLGAPDALRALALAILVAGALGPLLVATLAGRRLTDPWLSFLSPITGPFVYDSPFRAGLKEATLMLGALIVTASVLTLCAERVLAHRHRQAAGR